MTHSVRTFVLAAVLAAPLAGAALAQDATGSFGIADQAVSGQAPREFTARRLIETRTAVEAPAARLDRNAVPSSAF